MVSGAEPSMNRDVSNSIRTDCARKERTGESVPRTNRAVTPKGVSQIKTKPA